jgi:lysophospholipase L1-like esterase
MELKRKICTGMLTANNLRYLLRDLFSTDRAAGAVNGTAAEPGPGTRTVTDAENKLSIGGGLLAFSGGKASPATGDPGLYYPAQARALGLMMCGDMTDAPLSGWFVEWGFDNIAGGVVNAGNAFALHSTTGALRACSLGVNTNVLQVRYDLFWWVVTRAVGAFYFAEIYGKDVRLLFASNAGNAATLYPSIANNNSQCKFGSIAVRETNWLPSPLISHGFGAWGASDGLGHAEGVAASIGAGGVGIAPSVEVGTWGVSGGKAQASALAGGVAMAVWPVTTPHVFVTVKITRTAGAAGLVVRYADANNYIYVEHDGTNIVWHKVVGGVDSAVIVDTTATYAAGAELTVWADEGIVRVTYNGNIISTLQTIADAGLQIGAGIGVITTNTGNSFDDLQAWAVGREGQYSHLQRHTPGTRINALFYGDSKTLNAGPLAYYASSHPNVAIWERPARIAVGGRTVASAKAAVDAELVAAVGTPDVILCNLGANEALAGLPDEATWKANYLYILDAMHTKYPSANIYLMRVWVRDKLAECNTLASWIGDLVAARSFVHLGPDERVFLENGDNGTTYTSDGTHPTSPDGYRLEAAQWRSVLGY